MTPTLSLRSPVDLLAAVPYLLGFHPTDSVVLLGLNGSRVTFQARADLVTSPAGLADQLGGILARQGFQQALIVGYGPAARVDPVVRALRERLAEAGVATPEALRVTGGRYWSYTCARPECCPPDGNPYVADTTAVAAQATLAGMVALPSRDALRAQLAPVTGLAEVAMRQAGERADRRARALVDAALTEVPVSDPDPGEAAVRAASDRFEAAGRVAVDQALDAYRAGRPLDDDAAAWLGILLVHRPVRDYAWECIVDDHQPHLALWTDLTRRVELDLRAAPATLLAFTAWQAGEGAITTIALEVALGADPEYPLAALLARAIANGLDPGSWPSTRRQPLREHRRRRARHPRH